MRVYRISTDVNKYQFFLPQYEEDALKLITDCTPLADVWLPPPVFILYPRDEQGDFYNFSTGTLITSPRATEALRMHLEMAGELLPLPFEGQEFTVLNVTECINCLNEGATEWYVTSDTGERISPKNYVFHRNRFTESVLFKIPQTCRAEILVVEGLHDPDEEFRHIVAQADLRGLLFEELWNDES